MAHVDTPDLRPSREALLDEALLHVERERDRRTEDQLWTMLGTLFRWRRFIIGTTALMAVASVVISLMLPKWYLATTRLLPPESGGANPLSAALLKNLPSSASALLGGSGGDYTRYMAILSSRTMLEDVVRRFNLVEVYELEEGPTTLEDAMLLLTDNTDFVVDAEYEFLSVQVLDRDPQRAAEMANYFVERLNIVNNELAAQSAIHFRRFTEARFLEAKASLDSVLARTEAFQQQYGVFDLPTQTQSYVEQLAALRTSALEAEVQYEALRNQYGPENAQAQAVAQLARAANLKYRDLLAGQESALSIAKDQVPAVAREYANLEMERIIQTRILEVIGPMYEQARFEEERTFETVQVLDAATPPVRKAKPKRATIVVAATLSAFILAVLFVLAFEWWRRNHVHYARRLAQAAHAPRGPENARS